MTADPLGGGSAPGTVAHPPSAPAPAGEPPPSSAVDPASPLIYNYGRTRTSLVLTDVYLLSAQAPLRKLLAASAEHHAGGDGRLAACLAADAAVLLAAAGCNDIEHALDDRLPLYLVALGESATSWRQSVCSDARSAADPTSGDAFTSAHHPALLRNTQPSEWTPWLYEDGLRETLGAVVHRSLQAAEERYAPAGERPWRPGRMALADAVGNTSTDSCRAAGLAPMWVPFVEVQMAHALARANELPPGSGILPPGSGPLDSRIPQSLENLAQLWAVTQADTLNNAHHFYRYSPPRPAAEEHSDADNRSARALAAAARPGLPPTAPTDPQPLAKDAVRAIEPGRKNHR